MKDKKLDKDEYLREVSANLVIEIFSIVKDQGKAFGYEFEHNLITSVVKNTVMVLVYNSLNDVSFPKKSSEQKKQEAIKQNFLLMKDSIQNAIADGFEAAMLKFTGQESGYYCKINTAGPPVNSLEI